VNDERAQLLSIATSLDELTARITVTADRLSGAGDDNAAADLYEVERTLHNANRRLARIISAMR